MNQKDGFQSIESQWNPQDYRLINFQDSSEKGVCYEESRQTWVTMHQHKSESDFITTSIEESLHQALREDVTGMENESENMDGEQEEELVKRLFWFMNDWV